MFILFTYRWKTLKWKYTNPRPYRNEAFWKTEKNVHKIHEKY